MNISHIKNLPQTMDISESPNDGTNALVKIYQCKIVYYGQDT